MLLSFSTQLDQFFRQSQWSVRRIAMETGIPQQTLANWLRGTQPRWHPALKEDLLGLGHALGLTQVEQIALLISAGCIPPIRSGDAYKEDIMSEKLPKGWFSSGSHPQQYLMGVDSTIFYESANTAFIQAKDANPEGFATLMQHIKADAFRANRVQLSAMIRTENIVGSAGLWMRVDGLQDERLAFDNMSDRPLRGTLDWHRCTIVLDVPEISTLIAFGMLLAGSGKLWIGDMQFHEVGSEVAITGRPPISEQPVNLSFTE